MVHLPPNSGRGLGVSEPAGAFAPAAALSRLGPISQQSAEIRSLAQERDPELFYAALLSYAGRLERQGASSESQAVLEVVAAGAGQAVATRARTRLQALGGTGELGARAEVLASRFFREVSEPTALFAMGGAGAVYRLSRLAALARLSSSPAGLLTRGFGGQALASSLAFSAEATSFPLLVRAGHSALGRSQEWSADQLGREIASSFFVLGGLKLAGAGAASLSRHLGPGNANAILSPVFRQTAMLGGILAGHRMEEWAGLRPTLDGATTAIDSLALLLQFNVAGRLSQRLFGQRFQAWERELDRRSETLDSSPRSSFGGGLRPLTAPAYAIGSVSAPRPALPHQFGHLMMEGNKAGGGGSKRPSGPQLPQMGIRSDPEISNYQERLNRQEAERILRELIPRALSPASVEAPGFVGKLLNAFGIPANAFDVRAFRQGFEIAQLYPERVRRLAFDFDEVTLHWAFGPRDLLSVMARGAEAAYFHTPAQSLEYEPLPASEGQGLSRFDRIWFEGVQRLLPMAFRQHVQFHPGMRALQLGMRLGQDSNLMMVTVGTPGRLMRLANEDPALKMIYFGSLPTDELSIGSVRGATNIYTREDIVQALRAAEDGNLRFPNNRLIESYTETLRRHPDSGDRLKHPALALLRGKRPFDALVDDSSFALEVLGALPGFTVFQVPSARPARTKNFTLGSIDAYLARSANGYVEALADLLLQQDWHSGPVENRPAPPNYPYQRFAIEIPWTKFGQGHVALGKEARVRGRALAEGRASVAVPLPAGAELGPLSLSESQSRAMVQRLYSEFEILLEGKAGEVAIEAANTLMFKEMALASPESFQATLDNYFSAEEQTLLPQAALPLAERSEAYYSRVASLVAVKTAVCNLLSLDVAEHAREIRIRYGRPLLSGMAAHRLNGNSLLTTLSDEGEIGIGIALIEPSTWSSGLIGIGVDLTGDRASFGNPELHALTAAAYKAVYPAIPQQPENSDGRPIDLEAGPAGGYFLKGTSLAAAQNLRGDGRSDRPLPIHSLSFQIGRATLGLVGIPAPGERSPRVTFRPPQFPYRIDEDGHFQLPRAGMTVAVLGDAQAVRTLELLRQGHSVIHLDRSSENAELTEMMVNHLVRAEGPAAAKDSLVRGDWYGSANADLIEAYFPFEGMNLPPRQSLERHQALHNFVDQALNSKLINGGSAFVVSDVKEDIVDLVHLVQNSSRLRVLADHYDAFSLPISGTFGPSSNRPVHYVIFRKEGSDH